MVSKDIRIAINRFQPDHIVEYGEWVTRTLTPEEQEELDALNEELLEYSDFTTAAELEDEKMQEIMGKRKRLEELEALRTGEPRLKWKVQDPHEVVSVLLLVRPNHLPVYIEGLTNEMVEKLLEPQLTLNIGPGGGAQPLPSQVQTPPGDDIRFSEIKAAIGSIEGVPTGPDLRGKTWLDIVVISKENPAVGKEAGQTTLNEMIYVMPVKYLQDDWGPINDRLKEIFGDRTDWHRAGKTSHWTVRF